MNTLMLRTAIVAMAFACSPLNSSKGQNAMLATPGFHHLHLNAIDPDAAIDFYTRQFPTYVEVDLGWHACAHIGERRPGPVRAR